VRKRSLVATAAAALTAAPLLVVALSAVPAGAHGSMSDPPSRA
jgi:predicted carbohydrate-binding protein with CBM5 and CBM33 domain